MEFVFTSLLCIALAFAGYSAWRWKHRERMLRRIIQASSRPGDTVLDFFAGSGTTGAVAHALGRNAVLIDDNPEAIAVMARRMPWAHLTRI